MNYPFNYLFRSTSPSSIKSYHTYFDAAGQNPVSVRYLKKNLIFDTLMFNILQLYEEMLGRKIHYSLPIEIKRRFK